MKGNFRQLVLFRRVYWNIFTSSQQEEKKEREVFLLFVCFFVLLTLRAFFIIRSNKAGESFLASSEPVWKLELVTFPQRSVKNGCRRTMEGSTMPPQGLLRQVWLLLLFCPFFMLPFLHGTLSTAGGEKKKKKTGGGNNREIKTLSHKFGWEISSYIYFLSFCLSPGPLIIQDRQCTVHGCENGGNNLMQQIKWIN